LSPFSAKENEMQRNQIWFIGSAIFVIVIAASIIFLLLGKPQNQDPAEEQGFRIGFGSDTVKARILDVLEEGTIELGETRQPYQILLVRILEGPYTGQLAEIDYGRRQIRPAGLQLAAGDEVLVTVSELPDGSISAFFTDFVRTKPLLWLLGTFIAFSLLISGWKGARSLLGMAFSLMVITSYVIPQILNGKDPVLISISGAFLMLAVTLYLTYGWTLKTHAAVLGTLVALVFTGTLSAFFVNLTRLTGFGSEDALFLVQQSQIQINLRGLVLGGMIIGALGVLDDLVITQASAVMELYIANINASKWSLFRSAMRIGQDHVAATINTLVLAYTGAALPTMLLFSLSGENFAYLVNLEFVTEEIVRTLVGSLGLIAAVPLTTVLSVLLAKNQHKLGKWRPLWGSLTGSDFHSHRH
jgi:uncharacterized membrane protein